MEMTYTLQGGIPILHPQGKLTGTAVSAFRDRLGLWIDDTNADSLLIDFAEGPEDRFFGVRCAGDSTRARTPA